MHLPSPSTDSQGQGRCLFGLETEYGFALPEGSPEQRTLALELLMSLARRTVSHLPGARGSGLFTASGARFYVDCGTHPEFCTPELDDPLELVRYVAAGDRMLERLATDTTRNHGLPTIWIFKSHVDYTLPSTWGCHENYGCRQRVSGLARELLPHLATRTLYTGAGGLNPFAPGIELVLSPRVLHVEGDHHPDVGAARPMFHTKEERLAGPAWSRLHVVCGESILSHRAQYLRVATTALVVAMAGAGLHPGKGVSIRHPLTALHRFNADLRLQATAGLEDGTEATALAIQRHYLEFTEAHLDHPALPAWAADACRLWRSMLDQLAGGPGAVARSLDWAIKLALYQARLQAHGLTPARLDCWNSVLRQLLTPQGAARGTYPLETLAANRDRLRPRMHELEPQLRVHGLAWDQLDAFLQLRAQLCELEVRFGRLGPGGLFNSLDHQGLLDHGLPGLTPDSIEEAVHSPPPRGRARVRGHWIGQLAGSVRHGADWDSIWDFDGRRIELLDPFVEESPPWTQATREGLDPVPEPPAHTAALREVNLAYELGEYERGLDLVRTLHRSMAFAAASTRARACQWEGWLQARLGNPEESLQAANRAARNGLPELDSIGNHLCALRFAGLVPRVAPMRDWVRRGEAVLNQAGRNDSSAHSTFLGHQAAMLLAEGGLAEACELFERACAMARRINPTSRVLARNLCALAEIHRRLGQRAPAARCLHEARSLQERRRFLGDYAEFNLPARARLLAHAPGAAKQCLHEARLIQRRLGHRFGLARTMFLQARLFPNPWHNQRRKRLLLACQREIPALRNCPLVARIMEHWDDWVGGRCEPGEDFFWGV